MVCNNCGNTMEEGSKFCTKCGQPMPEAGNAAEMAESVVETTTQAADTVSNVRENVSEAVSEATETISEAAGNIQEKLKKLPKKTLIVIGAVAVVVLLVLCNFGVVANAMSKLVKSPEKYYASIEKKETKALIEDLACAYENVLLNHSDVTNQSLDYNMELELSEEAYEMLASALNIDDGKSLSKMGLDFMLSIKGDVISAEAAAKLGKNQLISANGVADFEKGEAYGQIPELTDKYIGVDFSDYTEMIQEGLKQSSELVELLPKKAVVEKLLNRYIAIVVENIDDVKEESDTISVGDIEQKCTSIRIRLKAKDVVDILEAVCEVAKDDDELIDLVAAFGVGMAGVEEDDAKESVKEAIENVLDNIDSMKDSADEDAEVIMKVWVNNKGEVIGRKISVNEDEFVISYEMPQKGKKFELELEISDKYNKIEITGVGEKSSSSLSGEFKFEADGEKLAEVTVKNLDTKKTMQGLPTGSFVLKPSASFFSELGLPYAASSMVSGYEVAVDMKSGKSDSSVTLSLMDKEEMFVKVSMDAKTGSGKSASLPKKGILVEDEDDLMEWAESIDFKKFVKKLSKAGLPEEYVEELEDAADDIEDMLD